MRYIKEKFKNLKFVSLENCDSIRWGDLLKPEIITIEYGRHNDRIGAGVPVMSLEHINEQAKMK